MAIAKPVGKYNWMKVIDVMTKDPLTVAADESIAQADELMNTNNIRQIPVLQGTELVGIVTDRDIRSFLSGSLLEGPEAREKSLNAKVSEIMTTEPITVSPEDDLEEAVELLIEEKFGGGSGGGQIRGISGHCDLCGRAAVFFEPATRRLLAERGKYEKRQRGRG
jgi:acetoin utilization protein AcuB